MKQLRTDVLASTIFQNQAKDIILAVRKNVRFRHSGYRFQTISTLPRAERHIPLVLSNPEANSTTDNDPTGDDEEMEDLLGEYNVDSNSTNRAKEGNSEVNPNSKTTKEHNNDVNPDSIKIAKEDTEDEEIVDISTTEGIVVDPVL